MKRWAWSTFLALALFAAVAGLSPAPSDAGGTAVGAAAQPLVGFQAPDFTLQTLDGKTVRLSALRGQPVLLNFWATWCPPCRQELPDIERFYESRGQKLQIVGIDLQESPQTVRDFVTAQGLHWTFVLDGNGAVGRTYRVRGIPTSFFIDRNGVIRFVYSGPMSEAILQSFWDQTAAVR